MDLLANNAAAQAVLPRPFLSMASAEEVQPYTYRSLCPTDVPSLDLSNGASQSMKQTYIHVSIVDCKSVLGDVEKMVMIVADCQI